MAKNTIKNSSKTIDTLQQSIGAIAKTLKDCYDQLSSETQGLHSDWKDEKYDSFLQDIKPHLEAIKLIADRYEKWSKDSLERFKQIVIEYEKSEDTIK